MAVDDSDRTFSIGRTFSRAFGVMGHNPQVAFGATLLLSVLPSTLFTYFVAQLNIDLRDRNTMAGAIGTAILAFGVGMFLRALVQGCLVRATIADSEGRRAGFAECLGIAASRALPLIAVSFLFFVAFAIGMVLLLVPGIMFAIVYAVVAPVAVEERVGVFEAFGRASDLTRGARWRIFGLALLVLILIWLFEAVAGVTGIALLQNGTDPFSLPTLLFNGFTAMLVSTFTSAVQTALYVELRDWKDGPQTSKLTEIFA